MSRDPLSAITSVAAERTTRCAATTADDRPCGRAGVHEDEGALYCTQHHPPRVAATEDARHHAWELHHHMERCRQRLASLRVDIADAALCEPFDVKRVHAAIEVYRDEERRFRAPGA